MPRPPRANALSGGPNGAVRDMLVGVPGRADLPVRPSVSRGL